MARIDDLRAKAQDTVKEVREAQARGDSATAAEKQQQVDALNTELKAAEGTMVDPFGRIVDVGDARLRLEEAGIDADGLDDATAVLKGEELRAAAEEQAINDLIRQHTPRTIIGAPTPEELSPEDKAEVLQIIGEREHIGAHLGKDPTALTPADLAEYERLSGHDAVIENVLDRPLSDLSPTELAQARSALRNQAFEERIAARRHGAGDPADPPPGAPPGPGGSPAPTTGAVLADPTGAPGDPPPDGTEPAGATPGGPGTPGDDPAADPFPGASSGGGDGEVQPPGEAPAGGEPADVVTGGSDDPEGPPPDGTGAGDGAAGGGDAGGDEDGGVPSGSTYVGRGTLDSTDSALDGQSADVYEDADGNLFAVTDDGTVTPLNGEVTDADGTPVDPGVVTDGGSTTTSPGDDEPEDEPEPEEGDGGDGDGVEFTPHDGSDDLPEDLRQQLEAEGAQLRALRPQTGDGAVDPTDDAVQVRDPSAQVPDRSELGEFLFGQPGPEPQFGAGAGPTPNPGADSQGGGVTDPTDDQLDPVGADGPEDDPFDTGPAIEPPAEVEDAPPDVVELPDSDVAGPVDTGPDLPDLDLDLD